MLHINKFLYSSHRRHIFYLRIYIFPGDLIILREGDRVAADGCLIFSSNLKIDESILTGESFSVEKIISDRKTNIFSGTLVVAGHGLMRVVATGKHTQFGKIGKSLENTSENRTKLQHEINKLVRIFGFIGLGFSTFIILLYGFTRLNWPQAILAGIAAAMALLPEEFAVVLTIFFATGAWRLSKINVLTRRLSATENLGRITTLCVDKTGTLTQNKMNLRELHVSSGTIDISVTATLSEEYHELIEYGALASHIDSFDPMEKAIVDTLMTKLADTEHIHKNWELIVEYPLSPQLLAMSCVWKAKTNKNYVIAAKGAPEAIIDLCHLEKDEALKILEEVKQMASRGQRVLAVAKAVFMEQVLPKDQHQFDFKYIGLLGLEDPVRPGVAESLKECYGAGIRLIMMTGDYSGTAQSIARQIGMKNPANVITGDELHNLNDLELQSRIREVDIFARMQPEQKLRIVNALKANKEIVAMTGDGVNDAPSLKWADVGIAMGKRGTDVARESAGVVLLDDNFSSIIHGIRQGRRILDNIQKAALYILAIHVPIAGLAILPVLLNLPLVLLPPQIVFLELIIDPASTLAFDSQEEPDIMNRAPRGFDEPLVTMRKIFLSVMQGLIVLAVSFFAYLFALKNNFDLAISQTISFSSLVLGNLSLIILNQINSAKLGELFRIRNKNTLIILFGSVLFLALIIYMPWTQKIFGFAALNMIGVALCFMSFLCSLLGALLLKKL
jgi:Ca2+-transporting ATPase